ncbi:MAG: 4-(cytidine 5'-diphospho)-2-C-methyl-D-erythritol kinase [Chloroflexi bacterium]|nr:4-(cytidine 5'-diphospho)-2-C-methyl-D-erythritol kinase [Chloroflexota bacterium]MDA1147573.1 4-(cytidine 5'-diphospho)-2-C-methyl-D-erythritol kinase [Chloroflexota bacterium]MQC83057.1 4-(cytidine 5'-diphospho)-2-C-methyl-D-erythritol kinase [Chloroflexota bacterium]
MTSHGVRLRAHAKINLALEVVRRRKDGYHEIATVMTTLSLADRVVLRPASELSVTISGEFRRGIDPTDDLAGRAARAIADAAGRRPDVAIEVEKRIPSPAGLGGGSSDAGAVLRGLSVMWELNWSPERLAKIGATIGSDVPFFVHGGTAHCTGRGELVEPLRDLGETRLLVLVPPVPAASDKTAARYAALHTHDFSDGHRTQRLAHRIARGAPPPTNDLINAFEAVIERSTPELVAHYARYRHAAAPRLHLCGSGPAVYMFVHEQAKLPVLRREFEQLGATVLEARTISRSAALAIEELPAPAGSAPDA